MRRSWRLDSLDFLILAAIGLVVAIAAADSLRSKVPGPGQIVTTDADLREVSQVTPRLTRSVQVRDAGDAWVARFARGASECVYMTQALCERLACEGTGVRKIENCTRPTRAFRRTFEGVRVLAVAVRNNRAAARLSNGAVLELSGAGEWWLVDKLGGNAGRGFFGSREAARGNRFRTATDRREWRRTPRPHFSAR